MTENSVEYSNRSKAGERRAGSEEGKRQAIAEPKRDIRAVLLRSHGAAKFVAGGQHRVWVVAARAHGRERWRDGVVRAEGPVSCISCGGSL